MKSAVMAAVFAVGAFAAVAATNEIDSVAHAQPIIVEASRIGLAVEEMPSRVEVYDAASIASSGAHTLPEFFAKNPSVTIRTVNANPTQAQIAMRGYGENSFGRCKVVLDGEELNMVDMDTPNLMRVPLDQVERIEILYGPQTVLHGDNASAGVINIVTTKSYERKTKLVAKGGSYGTFGASARHAGGDAEEEVSYTAAYDFLRSDGYRENSSWQTHNVEGGLRKTFANGSYFGINAHYNWMECQLPGSLTEEQYVTDPRQSFCADDWTYAHAYGVGLESKEMLGEETYLLTDLNYAQKNRHSKWGDYDYENDYSLYSVRLNPRLVNETPIGGFDNKATVGFDGSWDHYDVVNGSAYLPPNPFFDRFRAAGYLHDEFFLRDDFSILAGGRVEELWNRWSRYDDLMSPRNDMFEWAYEVGLVYRPLDALKLYAKQTRFYRAPFCDEMNYVAEGETLEPESGYSVDVGVDYTFLKEFNVFLNGYGTWTQDEIFYNPYHSATAWGWSGYNCNAPSDTQRLGFDTGVSWTREKVAHALVKYGFVDARFLNGQYESCDVPLVPVSRVRAEAGYWLVRQVEVRMGYTYVSEQRFGSDFQNEAGWLSSYGLFDLGVVYEPKCFKLDGLKVAFTIENLFDKTYCDYAGYSDYTGCYYYPAFGRSFMITLSYAF